METYTTKVDQNIFDVAIQLYGSIEGVFDLLISNPKLSINDELATGTVLNYHDYFTINKEISDALMRNPPASVPHSVYYKTPPTPCVMMMTIPSFWDSGSFQVSGNGEMVIDWGDNSTLQTVSLNSTSQTIMHYYNNKIHDPERVVYFYGKFDIQRINLSELAGEFYPIQSMTVDELAYDKYAGDISGVMLCNGLNVLELTHGNIRILRPIYDLSLQILNLSQSIVPPEEFEAYLQYITMNYGKRRDCIVTADVELTDQALEYIRIIVNNPDWNINGQWTFNINGVTYDNNYQWASSYLMLDTGKLDTCKLM